MPALPTLPGGPHWTDGPADELAASVALRRLADRVEDEAVRKALADGWSYARIAEALGVTKQAVHQKHGKRRRGA
jgi:DNA-directed RNA polymerase specialized sigma24 family protein